MSESTNSELSTHLVAQVDNLPYRRLAVGPAGCQPAVQQTASLRQGFSLIEIMLAVALMTIIMLGLLAMFYQTQRAMKVGTAQVDVMSTGDATMRLLVDELKQVVAAGGASINLQTTNSYPPLFWTRAFSRLGEPQITYLDDLFFMRRENDAWIGTGYFVVPETENNFGGAGTLYRYDPDPLRDLRTSVSNAPMRMHQLYMNANRATADRVANGITHLQLRAFDGYGSNMLGNGITTNLGLLDFRTNMVPAYLELELGVLEPKAYARFLARQQTPRADSNEFAISYLTNQLDRVHLFRQRIPIRTVSTNQ